MSDIPVTPANLAAFLVVYSCLPQAAGNTPAKTPAIAQALTEEERAKLNLPPGGDTLIYDIEGGSVVFDMNGPTATISFVKADTPKALPMLEKLLKKEFPKVKQLEDVVHPRGGKMRLRVFEGDVATDRHVKIEVDYPDKGAGADEQKFVARVSAYKRMKKH